MNVPICTGVNALKLYSEKVVILEFGQGLWFGNRIEKSLINPNQCQKFGIQICDDPTYPHRKLVIEESEDLFIPITMEGSTCRIITHPPTDKDLHEFQKIILSDEFYWGPSKIFFEISSMEEEYRTSSNFHRYINIVESRVPCAPPIIQCRDNLVIHDFDRAMANVSIGLAEELMVDILIRKVRVKRTRSGFIT